MLVTTSTAQFIFHDRNYRVTLDLAIEKAKEFYSCSSCRTRLDKVLIEPDEYPGANILAVEIKQIENIDYMTDVPDLSEEASQVKDYVKRVLLGRGGKRIVCALCLPKLNALF
jgi:hypothetical protein